MLLDLNHCIKKYEMNLKGVIHIGAHFGEEIEAYLQIPTITSVLMFEPHPDTFETLKQKVEAHNYKEKFENFFIVNKGLGPFSCKIDMFTETANQGQSNSVLKPKVHAVQYPNIKFEGKIEIQLDPLDRYEPSEVFNFINIDVQGFEMEVFRGARKTLKNIDYIMTEVNRDELYEGCAQVEELDEFLSKHHFKRVETSWAGATWGDALYIKSDWY